MRIFLITQVNTRHRLWFRMPVGILRSGWRTTQPINAIFRRAFEGAGLPYFNPHSFRDMLVRHIMSLNLSVESLKAWSQNLGHADVLTTLTSYGQVPAHRQAELIRGQGSVAPGAASRDQIAALETLLSGLKAGGAATLAGQGDGR